MPIQISCPNKNHPDYKKKVDEVGEFKALLQFYEDEANINKKKLVQQEDIKAIKYESNNAFKNERLKPLKSTLDKLSLHRPVVSTPANKVIVNGEINENYFTNKEVYVSDLFPLLLTKMLKNSVVLNKLKEEIKDDFFNMSLEEQMDYIANKVKTNEKLWQLFSDNAKAIFNLQGITVDGNTPIRDFVGDYNDVKYFSNSYNTEEETVSFDTEGLGDVGSIPLGEQSAKQKEIMIKMSKTDKLLTGNTIEVSVKDLLAAARDKKERYYIETVTKGEEVVTLYERTPTSDGRKFILKRVSYGSKFESNKLKSVEQIKNLEKQSEIFQNTGTALHKMKEDVVKNLFSKIDFIDLLENKNPDGELNPAQMEEIADAVLSSFTKNPELQKVWSSEIKTALAAKIFATSVTYKVANTQRIETKTNDVTPTTNYISMIRSLLSDYVSIQNIQHKKNIEAKKKDPNFKSQKPNIITERIMFDTEKEEAGTIDFLAIFSDGDAAILDYKFMKAKMEKVGLTYQFDSEGAKENYIRNKEEGYTMQLARYSEMLTKLYGVKNVLQVRIKPSYLEYVKNPITNVVDNNSQVSFIHTSDKTTGLFPIKYEKTGNENLDKFIEKINREIDIIIKDLTDRKAWQTDSATIGRMNSLKEVVRSIQLRKDLSGYTTYIRSFIFNAVDGMNNNIESFDLKRINSTNLELEFVNYFLQNTANLMSDYKENFPDAYNQFMTELGSLMNSINELDIKLKELSVLRLREVSARQGMDDDVFMSYENASDISGAAKWLITMKNINHPLVQVFATEVDRLNAERIQIQHNMKAEMDFLIKKYDAWSGIQGSGKFKYLLDENKNLVSEYSKAYWEERKKHEDTTDILNFKWWKENFHRSKEKDLTGKSDEDRFQESRKRYEKNVKELVNDSSDKIAAETEVARKMKNWDKKNDINYNYMGETFSNWANVKYISPKDKTVWYSDKFKEMKQPQNKAALDLWEYFVKKNYEFAAQVGYEFDIAKNFVPNIHKSFLDTISQDGLNVMGMFKNYMTSIKNTFNDTSTGMVSKSDDKQIPILFMGFLETENKSEDLAKSFMTFATFINQYKHATNLRDIGNVIKRVLIDTPLTTVEGGKKKADPIRLGKFESEQQNDSNLVGAFTDYMNFYVYGETTKQDAITDILGEKGVRVVGLIQRISGRSSMAFNFMSSFAGSINARSQTNSFAVAGKYFTKAQALAANKAVSSFNKKLAFISINFEIAGSESSDTKADEMSANKLVRKLSQDPVYVFERWFGDADQKVILHAMMNNFAIDPITGIINQIDKLKHKYKNHDKYKDVEWKSLWDSTEEVTNVEGEIDYVLINQHTGKSTVVDYSKTELTEDEITEKNRNINTTTSLRKKVNEIIARVKGNMSNEDIATYRMSLLGRALGQYRNWIPSTFNERLKGEAYNITMDEYEIGRWRAGWRLFSTNYTGAAKSLVSLLVPFVGKDFNQIDNPKLQLLYDQFIQNNPTLANKVSYEDYVEEHKGKMRSLAREIQIYAAFALLLAAIKGLLDDDDEDLLPIQFLIAALGRVNMELGFYLPVPFTPGFDEFKKLVTKDPLPLMAELTNATGLVTNSFAETVDFIAGVENGKTISPRITGTKWELNIDEKKDPQGRFHYGANYIGFKNLFNYSGIRDNTKKEDTVWEYIFSEGTETNKR